MPYRPNCVRSLHSSIYSKPPSGFVIPRSSGLSLCFLFFLVHSVIAATPLKANSIVLSVALAALGLLAMRQTASAIAGVYYVAMTNGYNFVANQLYATDVTGATNNTLTNVVIAPPEGTRAYTYNVTNQVFLPPAVYHTNGGWTTNFDCSPGKGFVIYANSQWSNTFVGQVPTGLLTNFVPGTNAFSLMAAIIPLNGRLMADLSFPGTDGDDVFLFRTVPQVYSDAIT